MLTIVTTRFSAVVKAFIEQFPTAVVRLDGQTPTDPLDVWCTNQKLKVAINFSLVDNGKEILGFHDGPQNMWASNIATSLVKSLADKKLLRFAPARYGRKIISVRTMLSIASVIFFLVSIWFLLWFLSSSSLAFVDCNGTYSFSADNQRCRNPAISSALFAATFILSMACLIAGRLKKKKKK